MLKIGFCDDDLSVLKELQVLLDHYRVEKNRELVYTAYQSPLELLADMEKGLRFDILFLDVLRPEWRRPGKYGNLIRRLRLFS